MADDKLAQKRNVSGEPMEADPNHIRETTRKDPKVPDAVKDERKHLPEGKAQDKIRDEMPEAASEVKQRLADGSGQ